MPALPVPSSGLWPPPPRKRPRRRFSLVLRPGPGATPLCDADTLGRPPGWDGCWEVRPAPRPSPAAAAAQPRAPTVTARFSGPAALYRYPLRFQRLCPAGSPRLRRLHLGAGFECCPEVYFTPLADRVFWQIAERDACDATQEHAETERGRLHQTQHTASKGQVAWHAASCCCSLMLPACFEQAISYRCTQTRRKNQGHPGGAFVWGVVWGKWVGSGGTQARPGVHAGLID